MNTNDKINKIIWGSFELSKDTLVKNTISAVNSGKIPLDKDKLPLLVSLIQGSSEEAFHKCISSVSREISGVLAEETKSPTKEKTTSKKN
jgi:hypothetical protein